MGLIFGGGTLPSRQKSIFSLKHPHTPPSLNKCVKSGILHDMEHKTMADVH
jgi:hypothetical protein